MEPSDIQLLNQLTEAFENLNKGNISSANASYYLKLAEQAESPELRQHLLAAGLMIQKYAESSRFIHNLSQGKLEEDPPRNNIFISPFKEMHSNLRHLVWQTKQVAVGDLSQKVSFLGDFSDAFNQMIESLREKQALENALMKSEANLRELNDTKDKFFSIIAHDLRGSFSAILGFSNLLVSEYDEYQDSEKIRFISQILDAAGSTFKLLENLLAWSRSQTGSVQYMPESYNLNSLTQNNIDVMQGQASYKSIVIKNEIPAELVVFVDADSINSVIRNLISNALKFTPRKGTITLKARAEDHFAVLEITDTGVGMSEEKVEKLFRIDTKVTTLGTDREKGSGLGLLLCKEFVNRNGGEIWVKSCPGEGSTFTFTLPLAS